MIELHNHFGGGVQFIGKLGYNLFSLGYMMRPPHRNDHARLSQRGGDNSSSTARGEPVFSRPDPMFLHVENYSPARYRASSTRRLLSPS